MRISRTSLFVAAALVGFLASEVVPTWADSKESAAIRAGTEAWIKAFNAGDVETMVALYADDAVVMPPGAPVLKSKAALREFFAKDVAGAREAGVTLVLGDVRDAGASKNLGWDAGSYTVRDRAGAIVDSGSYLAVWRKDGGKWRYIRDMWNSDRAQAAAK